MANIVNDVIQLDLCEYHLEPYDYNFITYSNMKIRHQKMHGRMNNCLIYAHIMHNSSIQKRQREENICYFIIYGHLIINLENQIFELLENQSFMVPKGMMHEVSALKKSYFLEIGGYEIEPDNELTRMFMKGYPMPE